MAGLSMRTRGKRLCKVLRFMAVPAAFLVLAASAMAQTVNSPLVGVWKVVGWESKTADNQTLHAYGNHPGGYYLFSGHGHFMFIMIGDNRSAPTATPVPPAEAATLYATLFAFDGTYKLDGKDKFVVHVDDSWAPAWARTDQRRDFKIVGKTLTVVFTTNLRTGQDYTVTVTSERVE